MITNIVRTLWTASLAVLILTVQVKAVWAWPRKKVSAK